MIQQQAGRLGAWSYSCRRNFVSRDSVFGFCTRLVAGLAPVCIAALRSSLLTPLQAHARQVLYSPASENNIIKGPEKPHRFVQSSEKHRHWKCPSASLVSDDCPQSLAGASAAQFSLNKVLSQACIVQCKGGQWRVSRERFVRAASSWSAETTTHFAKPRRPASLTSTSTVLAPET